MMTLLQPDQVRDTEPTTDEPRSVVVREGSEMAENLRGLGWVARVGWRSTTDVGDAVWFVRFEEPVDSAPDS